MAEAIGVVASVITISKTLVAAVEAVRSLYQAEADLEKLQERIGNFADIVNEIVCHAQHTPAPMVLNSLTSAQNTLKRLSEIFETRITRYCKETQKIRRKAWLRNKSRIIALQGKLELHRDNLVVALSASTLASNAHSEVMLNVIGSDTALLRQSTFNIGARLIGIERELLNVARLSSVKDNIMLQIEQLAAAVASGQSFASNRGRVPVAMSIKDAFDCSMTSLQTIDVGYKRSSHGGSVDKEKSVVQFEDRQACSPGLGTILDYSPNFFPATYTASSPVLSFIITSFWQTQQSRTSRTNHYHVLFSKTSNVYQQLTVSIGFHMSSKYWSVSKIAKDRYQCRESAFLVTLIALPQILQDQIWQVLAARETLTEQTHVNLEFSYESEKYSSTSPDPPLLEKPILRPRHSSNFLDDRSIIISLEDLGCALYVEREVQTLASFEPPNRFVSIVAGILVEEVKNTRSPPSPSFLYGIQAFRCLDGIPGTLELQGVVIDSSRRYIGSYLLRLPQTKCKFFLDYLSDVDDGPWGDREVWARRLIEAVRQVHARGYCWELEQRTVNA